MALREKYNHAIQTAKDFRMEGSAEERNGKLYFTGTVKNQDDANRIWDAIKTVPDWRNDIVGEINVSQTATAASGTGGESATTYTVKPGDTLSKIAKEHLGDANAYNAILEANRDQLDDADKIKPGQILKIPART